jgi:hypothetical protein
VDHTAVERAGAVRLVAVMVPCRRVRNPVTALATRRARGAKVADCGANPPACSPGMRRAPRYVPAASRRDCRWPETWRPATAKLDLAGRRACRAVAASPPAANRRRVGVSLGTPVADSPSLADAPTDPRLCDGRFQVREAISAASVRCVVPQWDGRDHCYSTAMLRQCLRWLVDGLGRTTVSVGKAAVVVTAARCYRHRPAPNDGRPTPARPALPGRRRAVG